MGDTLDILILRDRMKHGKLTFLSVERPESIWYFGKMDKSYVSRAGLGRRGWNDDLLRLFDIQPSAEAPCPENCRQRMRLYDLDKVIAAENDPQWWAVPGVDRSDRRYSIRGEAI
jgi:hypothetical protein